MSNVGIHGIGVHLPPDIRRNDWWPEAIVSKWRERAHHVLARGVSEAELTTPGAVQVATAMARFAADPFGGAVERRVAAAETTAADMEVAAAQAAMTQAGVQAEDIDFVLVYSAVPDNLATANACAVHQRLGLRQGCLSVSLDTGCNSFMHQLSLAQALIRDGQRQCGLLIQSSLASRVMDPEHVVSAWWGEGATAAIVAPVSEGHGLLGLRHDTDGSGYGSMVVGVPGKHWYDEGRAIWYAADRNASNRMVLAIADHARQSISDLLAAAHVGADEVAFYAAHQPGPWFRPVTQESAGLTRARTLDTFAWAGTLSAANVPLVLHTAAGEGVLRDGDLTVLYSGGAGDTWSSVLLRWGV